MLFDCLPIFALTAVTAFSQTPADVSNVVPSSPAVFQATRFHFGEVDKGEKIAYSFSFKNTGTVDLPIKAITPT